MDPENRTRPDRRVSAEDFEPRRGEKESVQWIGEKQEVAGRAGDQQRGCGRRGLFLDDSNMCAASR